MNCQMLRSLLVLLLPTLLHSATALLIYSDRENLTSQLASPRATYQPTWQSLDTRPLPAWYDDAKVGIFIHWGVFSVPAFGSEWFWWNWKGQPDNATTAYVKRNYPPNLSYGDFARDLTAQWYNPNEWVDLFVRAGAKYVVLTSKHHEGYCMWNSSYCWQWNSMAVGPQRDIVGELAAAVKARTAKDDFHFGLYHSMFEWFNPLFIEDANNAYETNRFASQKTVPELYELVEKYSPEVVWSDGDWGAPDTYWNSTNFLAWLVNESPVRDTVVFNDRWGDGATCTHGSFYTCEDRFNPGVLIPHKWENCMTLDRQSWGYRRNMKIIDIIPIDELIGLMVRTVSCGGNILINVGPTQDGIIVPIFQERLLQLGQWLTVNGDAIYSTQPYSSQNDSYSGNVWYTMAKNAPTITPIILTDTENNILPPNYHRAAANTVTSDNTMVVYATVLGNGTNAFTNVVGVTLGSIPATRITSIVVLGNEKQEVIWKQSNAAPNGTDVMIPPLNGAPEVLQWAIVLQLTLSK